MVEIRLQAMMKMTRLKRPLTLALGLTAALVLASCGQAASPAAAPTTAPPTPQGKATAGHPTTSPAPSTSPSVAPSTPAVRRIDITVRGKQVTPAPASVKLAVGESLTIAVTSDKNNTLHAHGFEVAKDLKAGQRGEITIKGAQTGTFEFELHDPELRLFTVAVR
jgi:plastocyanin